MNLITSFQKARDGSNDLDNLGIACRDANRAKWDLMLEEFILLCKQVLEKQGYEVNKKSDETKTEEKSNSP